MINELTSEILFRCPHCQKLYCTDGEDHSSNTEFQCTECQEDFYLLSQKTLSGIYPTEKKSRHDFTSCTKCGFLKSKNNDECPSCGVLEARYNDIVKLESPRLYELNKKWNAVVMNIEDDSAHQIFLNKAQEMSALSFAAQKYIELKKIIGDDQVIEKYLKQIELRLEAVMSSYMNKEHEILSPHRVQSFNRRFMGVEITVSNVCLALGIIGVVFIVINVVRPLFPAMNGLFVAGIALSLGLWSISKNQRV